MPMNEDILKKLQGFRDSRSTVGRMARGNNMYPGGNAARVGGGPDIGRPAIPPGLVGRATMPPGQANRPLTPGTPPAAPPGLANAAPQASVVNANPAAEQMMAAARRRLSKRTV